MKRRGETSKTVISNDTDGPCQPGPLPKNPTFDDLIRDYRARHEPVARDEGNLFRSCPSLGRAIEYAGAAKDDKDLRFDHQRRIIQPAISESLAKLRRSAQRIENCRSFAELHAHIEDFLRPIYGIGDLYIYDTAVRLGLKLGLAPERVYLHAGTREGAKNLGLDVRRGPLTIDVFPEKLRKLTAGELEDVLCIYKDDLKGALARERSAV
jgi:hypothetical protein